MGYPRRVTPELVLVVLLGGIVLAPAVLGVIFWMANARYGEKGALVHDTFTPGRPCRLEIPASGALDVMLRIATTRSRGTSEGLTAVVEVERGEPGAARARFAVGLSPTGPRPEGLPFTASDGMSYRSSKHGRETTRTKVIARIPAGGAGYVTVDVLTTGADVGYCAAFVKPVR